MQQKLGDAANAEMAVARLPCWPASTSRYRISDVDGESAVEVSVRTVVEMAQRISATVRIAQADVQKAAPSLAESRDVFIPAVSFGSGLPVFPEVGFTGNLPTIWDANVQSMAFSMSQFRYIQGSKGRIQSMTIEPEGLAGAGSARRVH